jgi:putative secretion ATPase (PEP-CTERM system associated)
MYETFYKLSGNPFQLNPDPSFYFASKGHSRAFAYLKYGIAQGDGLIVITGEIGAGKTTLVRTLMGELDDETIVAAQLSSTQLDAEDLVHAVANAFGLPAQGLAKAEMLARFEAFLTSLVKEKRRALLIVDEAQNLTSRAMEELRMLSNFQFGARPLLQSFLVGQPELRDILRAPTMEQLRQRIIASFHLGPMGRTEMRAYIFHRLKLVGWAGDPQIDEAIMDRLFEATGGLPRAINGLCNRLMLGAFLAEKHEIGSAELTETLNEMRGEIGGEPRPAPRENSINGVGVTRPMLTAALTQRLDRIERNVATAVDLLQQIAVNEGKPVAMPTATAPAAARPPRPRFAGRG